MGYYLTKRVVHTANPGFPALARKDQTFLSSLLLPCNNGMVDVVRQTQVDRSTYSGTTTIVRQGKYTHSNSATGTGHTYVPGICQNQKFSRVARIYCNSITTTAGTISDSRYASAANGAQWYVSSASGGTIGLNKSNAAAIASVAGLSEIANGKWVNVGVTYDGTNCRFYVNGRYVGGGSSAQTFTIDSSGALFKRGSSGEIFNGDIELHYDFSKALSDADMVAFTNNPWSILEPKVKRIWVPSAGGSITVTPSAAIARALGISPTLVLGSTSATPSPAIARAVAVAPTTILGSLVITPAVAAARAAAQVGGVVLGSIVVAPAAAAAKAAAIVGSVLGGEGLVVTASAAIARCAAVITGVVLGSVSVSPAAAVSRTVATYYRVLVSGMQTAKKTTLRTLKGFIMGRRPFDPFD